MTAPSGGTLVVRLGTELLNSPRRHYDCDAGRLFVNIEDGNGGTNPKNTFYQVTPCGEHGITLLVLPCRLESGFKTAEDVFGMANHVGVTPYRPPHIVCRILEPLTMLTGGKHYKTRIELGDGFITVSSSKPIFAGSLVYAYSSGPGILQLRELSEEEASSELSFDTFEDLANYALQDGENFPTFELEKYIQHPFFLMAGGIISTNREGVYRRVETVDGESAGSVTHLVIYSVENEGRAPIPNNASVMIRATRDPNVYQVLLLAGERPMVKGILRDWKELPAIFGRQPKGSTAPSTVPKSGNIRVIQTQSDEGQAATA